jgi:myosin heavy subunit
MELNQDAKCKPTMQSTGRTAPETGKLDEDLQDHRISKIDKDLQAQKDTNVALENRIKAVRDLFDRERKHHDQLQVRYQALKQECADMGEECADMGDSLQNQDCEIQSLSSQNSELRYLLAEEKDSKKSMSLKLEDQQARTQELESRVKSQEISVTKAQEAAVKVLSITVSNAIPDDRIRRQFSDLFRALHNWARENSIEDLSGLRNSSFLSTLVDRKVLADRETWKPEHRFDFDSRTAPATLLNASLTKEVCSAFFKIPFAFIQEDEKRSGSEPGPVSGFTASTVSVLRSVEKNLRQCK